MKRPFLIGLLAVFYAASAPAAEPSPTSVSSSTRAADGAEATGRGFKVAGDAPKAKLVRPLHAVIHKDAVDWEPLSLRQGGVPGEAGNEASLKVVLVKGRMKGERTRAASAARLHAGKKDSRWLVISSYPKSLDAVGTHFELRFRVFEGYVEDVEVAAITISNARRVAALGRLDSYDLRERGIEYIEERPGSGQLIVAELDPRTGKTAVNSGRLEKAEFPGSRLGFVNLSWAVKGVGAER